MDSPQDSSSNSRAYSESTSDEDPLGSPLSKFLLTLSPVNLETILNDLVSRSSSSPCAPLISTPSDKFQLANRTSPKSGPSQHLSTSSSGNPQEDCIMDGAIEGARSPLEPRATSSTSVKDSLGSPLSKYITLSPVNLEMIFNEVASPCAPLISTPSGKLQLRHRTSMKSGPSQHLSTSSSGNLKKECIVDGATGGAKRPLQPRALNLLEESNQQKGLDCSLKKKRPPEIPMLASPLHLAMQRAKKPNIILEASASYDAGGNDRGIRSLFIKKKIMDGTKSCNCRKSQCIKLYCDCFANGSFCNENCGCTNCSNKPEQEEKILLSRQLIKGRNSYAFAPKVVLRATQPAKESVTSTSAFARHKIGCSCRKSLCIKKYCECFQAGVGCFSGCRCEDCQNQFGRMGGCDKITGAELQKDITETEKGIELSGPDRIINIDEMKTELPLNPDTPTIQCSMPRIPSNSSLCTSSPASPTNSISSILELLESVECTSPSIFFHVEPPEQSSP